MKKYIFLFFAVCAFSVYANAQNRTGDCTSYTSDDRSVTFYLNDSSAIQLRLCSQSTVRIWFSPDGSFQRSNPSFAVVNEDLEDVGTVHVDEQNACYEIFTPKLRIRVNKSPFNLQIFDKYQKLLFSDYADKGHISDGQRKLEYKTLRRDEHFFGLGEKTGKLDRRGEAYKMWNSDKPCYSAVEDPLYKSIPFFMSSYRYGIFLDNTYKTEFKFGTESRDYYSFEAPGVPIHGLELGLGVIEGFLGFVTLCVGILERLGLFIDALVGLIELAVQVAQLLLLLLGLVDGRLKLVDLLLKRGDFCRVLLGRVVAQGLCSMISLLLRLLLRLARRVGLLLGRIVGGLSVLELLCRLLGQLGSRLYDRLVTGDNGVFYRTTPPLNGIAVIG